MGVGDGITFLAALNACAFSAPAEGATLAVGRLGARPNLLPGSLIGIPPTLAPSPLPLSAASLRSVSEGLRDRACFS